MQSLSLFPLLQNLLGLVLHTKHVQTSGFLGGVIMGTLIFSVFSIFPRHSQAALFQQPYFPPDMVHQSRLKSSISISGKVNINHASLAELTTLPGIDENLGLKLIRLRPFNNIQDLNRLPSVDQKRIERLIVKIQGLVRF